MTGPSDSARATRGTPLASRREGILVLGKVKAVLDALGELGQAGPSEIAARIGANKSTTFRLVNSMERIGLLDRTPGGAYALGLWLMELGALVESRLDLRRVAEPELEQLHEDVALTTFLTVRHANQATCIDRIAGPNVDVLALRLGGILPLYSGAGPRVLLAGLEESELAAYLSQAPFRPLTPHTLTSNGKLRADVEITRRRRYVLSMEDVTIGVAAIGVPVFDASGGVAAAISVAGLRHEFEGDHERALAKRLQASAARVSAALGAPPVLYSTPADDGSL
jgi:DNA-binding IclR family transcriptional regulator